MGKSVTDTSHRQHELRLGIGLAGLFVIGCFVAAVEMMIVQDRAPGEPHNIVRVAEAR